MPERLVTWLSLRSRFNRSISRWYSSAVSFSLVPIRPHFMAILGDPLNNKKKLSALRDRQHLQNRHPDKRTAPHYQNFSKLTLPNHNSNRSERTQRRSTWPGKLQDVDCEPSMYWYHTSALALGSQVCIKRSALYNKNSTRCNRS